MRLLEPGLPGQGGARQRAVVDAPDHLLPQQLVKIVKVHTRVLSDGSNYIIMHRLIAPAIAYIYGYIGRSG